MKSMLSCLSAPRFWIPCQLVGSLFLLTGCNFEIYGPKFPHQNFVNSVKGDIGKKISDVDNSGNWADPNRLIGKTALPNGRLAYHYQYGKECHYSYEVNPVTEIILSIHVGNACSLAP